MRFSVKKKLLHHGATNIPLRRRISHWVRCCARAPSRNDWGPPRERLYMLTNWLRVILVFIPILVIYQRNKKNNLPPWLSIIPENVTKNEFRFRQEVIIYHTWRKEKERIRIMFHTCGPAITQGQLLVTLIMFDCVFHHKTWLPQFVQSIVTLSLSFIFVQIPPTNELTNYSFMWFICSKMKIPFLSRCIS